MNILLIEPEAIQNPDACRLIGALGNAARKSHDATIVSQSELQNLPFSTLQSTEICISAGIDDQASQFLKTVIGTKSSSVANVVVSDGVSVLMPLSGSNTEGDVVTGVVREFFGSNIDPDVSLMLEKLGQKTKAA